MILINYILIYKGGYTVMETDVLLTILGSYAFPIVVTIYLLYERSTTTKTLIDAVNNLTNTTNMLVEYLKGGLHNEKS